jgi:hypothetical protein
LLIIPICALFLQFWTLYSACKARAGLRYIFALFFWGFGFFWFILQAVGVPWIGSCGLISSLLAFFQQTGDKTVNKKLK